ncbi:hypothetical protein, partial [Lewinella cohaerens]|uniref:hypothetical protein n=1 Tax=Lewinella cohaerens TaxID=70995 RepID=UPI001B7F9BAC
FFGQARVAQASPLRYEPRTTRDMRKFKNFFGCVENFRTSHVPKNVVCNPSGNKKSHTLDEYNFLKKYD